MLFLPDCSPHFASRENLLPQEYWQDFDLLRLPSRRRETNAKSSSASTSSACRVEFSEVGCDDCGDTGENWLCLGCGGVFCSRFVLGHMQAHCLAHTASTSTTCSSSDGDGSVSSTATATAFLTSSDNGANLSMKHCLALSLSDLSCWCSAVSSTVDSFMH